MRILKFQPTLQVLVEYYSIPRAAAGMPDDEGDQSRYTIGYLFRCVLIADTYKYC